MRRFRIVRLTLVVVCAVAVDSPRPTAASASGVAVADVQPGSPGADALRAGDRIVGWAPAASPGDLTPLSDPLAAERLESSEGARAPIRLRALRGSEVLEFTIARAPWGIRWSADLPEADRLVYQAGTAPRATPNAVVQLRDLAGRLLREDGRTAAWLYLESSDARVNARQFDEAERDYEAALTWAQASGEWRVIVEAERRKARALARRARAAEARQALSTAVALETQNAGAGLLAADLQAELALLPGGKPDEDRAVAQRSLEIRQQLAPASPAEAAGWIALGRVEMRQRQLGPAIQDFDKAIALLQDRPDSLLLADALDQRGTVRQRRGELDESDADYQAELRIRQRSGARTMAHANVLNNLGINASMRGELDAADKVWEEAAAIYTEQAPDSLDIANLRNNQGVNAMLRGRLDEAESLLRESLTIKERVAASSMDISAAWHNLGIASAERQDLDAADGYFRRALEIRRTSAPDSAEVAQSLNNLAGIARRRTQLSDAEALAREALQLRRRLVPGSLELAFTLTELGRILEARGDLVAATAAHLEALSIRDTRAPNSTSVAETLRALGTIDLAQGRLAEAQVRGTRALALWQRLAPGSTNEAESHVLMAHIARAAGHPDDVLASLRAAIDATEVQGGHLGGTQESQAQFRAAVNAYYGELIEELVARDRAAEAFHVLERSRARSFLAMLAERQLAFASELPADLAAAQRAAAREYEDIQDELAGKNAATEEAMITELLGKLQDVRSRQAELRDRIRKASPRLAALQYPEPLDAAAAAHILAPGTVVLSYAVRDRDCFLFTLTSDGVVHVARLGLTASELSDRVSRFRRVIDQGRTHPQAVQEVMAQARGLGQALLGPAMRDISRSQRLLIVPDGALHDLPFAALVTPDSPGRFLVESRPVQRIASITLLADLRSVSPAAPVRPRARLAGYADPAAAVEPLPGARRELTALGRLFGADAALAFGDDATESRVKETARDVRFLHFATHAVINARRSLDSALVLTPSKTDNGMLQAWEVFEQVRTSADTVVLSACSTEAGGVYAGEGLLGLTRAFQYAGARSIVASLWAIADEPTPDLMRHFYVSLQRGLAKDDALAAAQRRVLSSPRTRHPYYWAAFVLDGDRQ